MSFCGADYLRAEFVLAIQNLDKSLKSVPIHKNIIKLEFIMTHL